MAGRTLTLSLLLAAAACGLFAQDGYLSEEYVRERARVRLAKPHGLTLEVNVLAGLLYFLLFHMKLGKAMRAMADNADLALVSGINTDRIIVWTWAIGGGLMAIAGALLAIQASLKPDLGFGLILPLFAATILGGIGKPHGAFIGAMVVGVTQEVSVEFFSAGYKPAVAIVILIFILLLRPRGLFGSTS